MDLKRCEGMRMWTELTWLRIGSGRVKDSCEHGNETLSSIKGEEFHD
jgi:hypothetical protein